MRARPIGVEPLPLPRFDALARADDPVLRLVVGRAAAGSRPGPRADGARVALAVEGGGMAGSVTAGMCLALEALGLVDSFDVVYGSSAGAINASYTAAGQARSRAALYLAAAAARLVDPRRALRGRAPFRLGELVHGLLGAHPHDPRLLHGRPPLRVTATRVEDKGLDVLADFASLAEMRQAVWASCAIPILAGDVVDFRGTRYVDGGLIESLPYGLALREGATHVLVLRARPAAYRLQRYPTAKRLAIRRLLRNAPDTVVELIYERPARYNAEAGALQSGDRLRGRVQQIAPPTGSRLTGRLETRPRYLEGALALGARTAYAKLAPYLAPQRARAEVERLVAA